MLSQAYSNGGAPYDLEWDFPSSGNSEIDRQSLIGALSTLGYDITLRNNGEIVGSKSSRVYIGSITKDKIYVEKWKETKHHDVLTKRLIDVSYVRNKIRDENDRRLLRNFIGNQHAVFSKF